jgi:AP-1-like factor
LLKAQIEKQQAELREYKKRLSMHGNIKRSPSSTSDFHIRNFSGSLGDGFQFDFANFGSQSVGQHNAALGSPGNPHSTIEQQDNVAPGTTRSLSQKSPAHVQSQDGYGSQVAQSLSPQEKANIGTTFPSDDTSNLPTYNNTNDSPDFSNLLTNSNLNDLFSPSLFKSANLDAYLSGGQLDSGSSDARTFTADNGGDTTAGLNRAFQFNGDSNASDTTSPSASSNSQWNANGITTSSCETSPEPYAEGPSARNKSLASNSLASPQNSLLSSYNSNSPHALSNVQNMSTPNLGSIDYSVPSAAGFDPVLFGDYRESQAAIVGSGDFTGGFFDDALYTAPVDYSSPSSLFGILQTPQSTTFSPVSTRASTTGMPSSKKLLAEMEKAGDGEETATSHGGSFISCNKIWYSPLHPQMEHLSTSANASISRRTQLQNNPDFQDGKFDLDQLCSELRTKAKCSETGMMVPKEHVDKALAKLGSKETASQFVAEHPYLTFDPNGLDDLMKKFSR